MCKIEDCGGYIPRKRHVYHKRMNEKIERSISDERLAADVQKLRDAFTKVKSTIVFI